MSDDNARLAVVGILAAILLFTVWNAWGTTMVVEFFRLNNFTKVCTRCNTAIMPEGAPVARKVDDKGDGNEEKTALMPLVDHGRMLTGVLEALNDVTRKRDSLFEAIRHGDEKHRAWLKQAIDDHFAGKPVVQSLA